jgi:hypothetical protein
LAVKIFELEEVSGFGTGIFGPKRPKTSKQLWENWKKKRHRVLIGVYKPTFGYRNFLVLTKTLNVLRHRRKKMAFLG